MHRRRKYVLMLSTLLAWSSHWPSLSQWVKLHTKTFWKLEKMFPDSNRKENISDSGIKLLQRTGARNSNSVDNF